MSIKGLNLDRDPLKMQREVFPLFQPQDIMTPEDLAELMGEAPVLTVQDLIDQLMMIKDKTALVHLESGEPVHYTCQGLGGTKKVTFFIGVL